MLRCSRGGVHPRVNTCLAVGEAAHFGAGSACVASGVVACVAGWAGAAGRGEAGAETVVGAVGFGDPFGRGAVVGACVAVSGMQVLGVLVGVFLAGESSSLSDVCIFLAASVKVFSKWFSSSGLCPPSPQPKFVCRASFFTGSNCVTGFSCRGGSFTLPSALLCWGGSFTGISNGVSVAGAEPGHGICVSSRARPRTSASTRTWDMPPQFGCG